MHRDEEQDFLTELKAQLVEGGHEDSILLENPSFYKAIVGVIDGHVVYSYSRMVECMTEEYVGCGVPESEAEDEAREWIEYNTMRAIPYMKHDGKEPYILDESYVMF